MTSIGDAELVTVRSVRRVPVMTIWSLSIGTGQVPLPAPERALPVHPARSGIRREQRRQNQQPMRKESA